MRAKALSLSLCVIALSSAALAAKSSSIVASLPPVAQSIIAAAVRANNSLYSDAWIQQAILTPSDPQDNYGFGLYSVAVDGDTIVVGVPYYGGEFGGLFINEGAAYVFVKTGANWTTMTQAAVLTASDAASDALLGYGVAIVGDTIVAGAPAAGNLTPTVYLYVKPTTGWANMTQTAKLTASDGGMSAHSVSMSGNTIVANGSASGTVGGYVFVEPVSGWTDMTQTAELTMTTASGLGGSRSVAINGGTVAVSAAKNVGTFNVGKVVVYAEPTGGWTNMTQTAVLSATAATATLSPVAISGNVIATGDFGAVSDGETAAGDLHVFVKPAGGWINATQTAILTASDAAIGSGLGFSVSISGNTIVGGAFGAAINGDSGSGALYVYTEPATGWQSMTQSSKLDVSRGDSGGLGWAVAVQGNIIVGSSPFYNGYVGEARVFRQ
jgi:hypothetical protein